MGVEVSGFGFQVSGFGFRVSGFVLRVYDFWFGIRFRLQGLGVMVYGSGLVLGFSFGVGFRVEG